MADTVLATSYEQKPVTLPRQPKRKWKITRRQRRIAGLTRESLPSCVIPTIYREVEKRAARYGVSRSFLIAVVLAEAFGIVEQERF